MSASGNGWRPRVVALDVDGTVLDHDGSLPAEVRAAVRAVADAGVPVVLATGRSWHSTLPVVEQLGLATGPSVCSNGAVIVDFPPERIVKAITFDPRAVIAKVESFAPGTLIAVEEIGRGYRLNGHFPVGDLTGEMLIEDVEELSSRPVTRIILRDPARSDRDFVTLAEQLGLHGVQYYVGYSAWLDIAPRGSPRRPGSTRSSAVSTSARPTCSPSVTVATTPRCWPGPVAASRWVRPRPRCGRSPTR